MIKSCKSLGLTIMFIWASLQGRSQNVNIDDINSCKSVLCSGGWIFDSKFLLDSTAIAMAELQHANSQFKTPAISLEELAWYFNTDGTFQIVGKSITSPPGGASVEVIRDTVFTGFWKFEDQATTQYFVNNGYDNKIRMINIKPLTITYACLRLVQNGLTMDYWYKPEGNDIMETQEPLKLNVPFLFCNNVVWLHTNIRPQIRTAWEQANNIQTNTTEDNTPKNNVVTLIGVFDKSMRTVGALHFMNARGDTTFYCESLDSCIADGKPAALFASPDAMQTKTEFTGKKFKITYTVDNNNQGGNDHSVNITVTKMILEK